MNDSEILGEVRGVEGEHNPDLRKIAIQRFWSGLTSEERLELVLGEQMRGGIERVLCLSTHHIPDGARSSMERALVPYVRVVPHRYGWIVFFSPDTVKRFNTEAWLVPIVNYAMKHDAEIIYFDEDNDIVDELPVFDW